MNFKEAYSILGISEESTKEEAKKAFRKLAQKKHPDVNKEPDAEAQFKKINEAYQVIESGEPSGEDRRNYSNQGNHASYQGNIEDLFQNFSFRNFSNHVYLEDINISTTLSFKESVLGCKKKITYNRKNACAGCRGQGFQILHNGCKTCDGKGVLNRQQGNMVFQQTCSTCKGNVKQEPHDQCKSTGKQEAQISLDVQVPGGVESGNILRLGGVGNYGGSVFGSEQYSNVHVHINVIPEKNLKLEGQDVICDIDITLLNALSGSVQTVPTIHGQSEITIPSLFKNKDEITIPKLGVNGVGNQRVKVNVRYPDDTESLIEFLKTKEN